MPALTLGNKYSSLNEFLKCLSRLLFFPGYGGPAAGEQEPIFTLEEITEAVTVAGRNSTVIQRRSEMLKALCVYQTFVSNYRREQPTTLNY